MGKNIKIAIDGPVGSGKGTLSLELAKKLNAVYLYTGGMYRALTLACLRRNINLENEEEVLNVLRETKINPKVSEEGTKIFIHEEMVDEEIFKPEVSNSTPIIAAHPKVREEMVKSQKEIVKGQSAVIEGRDIATDVAPDADLKIFLTANPSTRAKRRYEQFRARGIDKSFEEVMEDTLRRDELDTLRKTSPMGETEESFIIDTTNDSVSDTLQKVIEELKRRGLYGSS